MEPILVNSREAAKMLGISERKLFDLTKRGEIPSVKTGKSVRYRPESLRQWAETRERSKASQASTIISSKVMRTNDGQY